MSYPLEALIDLDRYPIHDLDGEGRDLLARCREMLDTQAICHLPEFVREDALAAIQAEARARIDDTYWMTVQRRAYSWRDPLEYPEGHPVTLTTPNRVGTITGDMFPREGAFVSTFEQPALTEFIRQCMRFETLHPVACPYLAANVKVMDEGARHAWHFDQNDGAVTFMIEPAAEGGHFEYIPLLRDDGHENYDAVGRLLRGEESGVLRAGLGAGSFCLFRGRRSIHRVSEVTRGNPDRLLAVFSYHHAAGHRYPESTVKSVLGRLPDTYADPP